MYSRFYILHQQGHIEMRSWFKISFEGLEKEGIKLMTELNISALQMSMLNIFHELRKDQLKKRSYLALCKIEMLIRYQGNSLTFTTLWTNSADDKLTIYSPENSI